MKAVKTAVVDVDPKVGDVIRYKNGDPLLVVEYGTQTTSDAHDGAYYAYTMKCVDFNQVLANKFNPTEHTFLLPGSSMGVEGAIDAHPDDFELVEERKFTRSVTIMYHLEE